jgi:hypothetical protein
MTHASTLDELERDVARARARLSDDLARLRDPGAMAEAKADLMDRASDYKDRLVEKVSGVASQRAYGFTDALVRRAQDNPAAVVVMGVGLAWRLWKHPPIATLLLGAGLASLLAGRGEEGRAAPDGLLGRVQDVNRVTHPLGDRAAELAERAGERVVDLAEQARLMGDRTATTLSHAADRTAVALADLNERQGEALRENPVAMSVAAMALGAALGVALRRRA